MARLTDSTAANVDFRTIAPSSWSRLYVFGSYTSKEAAERILGVEWNYRWPPIEHQDGDALFVFVDSGRVALAVHYPHHESRLTGIRELFRADGYPRDSARFQLVPDTAIGEPYLWIVRGGGLTQSLWRPADISGVVAASAPGAPVVRAVYGRVTDAGTTTALAGVRVAVHGMRVGSVTRTDGAFTITAVPADSVQLDFRHPCYLPVIVSVPLGGDVAVTLGLPFDHAARQRTGCGGLGARVDTARE